MYFNDLNFLLIKYYFLFATTRFFFKPLTLEYTSLFDIKCLPTKSGYNSFYVNIH